MAWFSRNIRTFSVVAATTGAVVWCNFNEIQVNSATVCEPSCDKKSRKPVLLNNVLASYTNNFVPSARWDENWDR